MADDTSPGTNLFDVRTIRFLAAIMSRHDLSEIDLYSEHQRLRLLRQPRATATPPPAPAAVVTTAPAPVPAAPAAAKPARNLHPIKSQGVGTFYTKPKPDAEPFVQVGDRVTPATVVGLLEAMKLFNDITADCAGVVAEIVVENQQAVEFGQTLFLVDTTA